MKKMLVLLLTISLSMVAFPPLFVKGRAQTTSDKLLKAGNPIPGQYIVVLKGTDLSPIVDPTPEEPPPPGEELPPEPEPGPSDSPEPTSFMASRSDFLATVAEPVPGPTATPAPEPSPEPLPSPEGTPPPDPEVVAAAEDLTGTYGGTYSDTYGVALKGFLLHASESEAAAMSEDPRVEFIEEDGEVTMNPTQFYPPWGLDRIDQRWLPLNRTFNYRNTGAGVIAYIIDTGIRPSHIEYRGRAYVVYDALGGNGLDCNGHGTHVAGTVGGRTYGVAKSVYLFGVRVLNCAGSGSWSSIINGVNFVTWHRWYFPYSPVVANMSLGGGANASVDAAVRNSIRARVTYVVAAGNSNYDARFFSPARVAEAITVGATDWNDFRAWFSNYGPALDLFAPGVNVTSAWHTSDFATNTISGTSMASPHTAGVAALYLQSNPWASPATVSWVLNGVATPWVVRNPGPGSPNRLLFTYF